MPPGWPKDPKSVRPPASRGPPLEQEPWCPSSVHAEATGVKGEKRRGLSRCLSLGTLLWEEEQNFWGTTGLSVSLGSTGGGRDRSFLASCLVAVASWVTTAGWTPGLPTGSLRGPSSSVAPG